MEFRSLALLHLVFTVAMVGFMTTIQMVVYPAFRRVSELDFPTYVTSHGKSVGLPLLLFAPAEVVLALFLWLEAPPGLDKTAAFISGLLLAIGWITTMVWYGPFHDRLAQEPYDIGRIDQLISTNWLRTAIWWVRGLLALWFVWAL